MGGFLVFPGYAINLISSVDVFIYTPGVEVNIVKCAFEPFAEKKASGMKKIKFKWNFW
ncbi:hypothetical protein MuYL_2344 [Mucilaginibacter xinganensis]|uniref:Uncharacterized protein n=1 Tax=Mucilaginibacter xinganensis TaxID=1234841 RepID=A0A223NWI6_9SPHI|nr:hypothetical protein MuYL_2344 [Mucilaginibacter xinganensis]